MQCQLLYGVPSSRSHSATCYTRSRPVYTHVHPCCLAREGTLRRPSALLILLLKVISVRFLPVSTWPPGSQVSWPIAPLFAVSGEGQSARSHHSRDTRGQVRLHVGRGQAWGGGDGMQRA